MFLKKFAQKQTAQPRIPSNGISAPLCTLQVVLTYVWKGREKVPYMHLIWDDNYIIFAWGGGEDFLGLVIFYNFWWGIKFISVLNILSIVCVNFQKCCLMREVCIVKVSNTYWTNSTYWIGQLVQHTEKKIHNNLKLYLSSFNKLSIFF